MSRRFHFLNFLFVLTLSTAAFADEDKWWNVEVTFQRADLKKMEELVKKPSRKALQLAGGFVVLCGKGMCKVGSTPLDQGASLADVEKEQVTMTWYNLMDKHLKAMNDAIVKAQKSKAPEEISGMNVVCVQESCALRIKN